MNIIDLHGMYEEEAIVAIDSALFTFRESMDDALEIITGNGIVLRDVAIELIEGQGFEWSNDGSNTGALIVTK